MNPSQWVARGRACTVAILLSASVPVLSHAQVRPPVDTTQRTVPPTSGKPVVFMDSVSIARRKARQDSIDAARAGDTLRSPIARFASPQTFENVERLRFDREQIVGSGAINLADLLDRVPGITSFRSGWVAGVHTASFLGDFSRIRVFVDGLEVDALDGRNRGVLDVVDIPLWTFDELVIERTAREVRVWCRTWSTTKTVPYTRVDISTGDLNTNGFRALFARRFRSGFALQVAGQQIATQRGRVSALGGTPAKGNGDGTNQTMTSRLGWARGRLSIDAYGSVITRDRDIQNGRDTFPAIPKYKGTVRQGYVRVGYGDTTGGLWTHLLASATRSALSGVLTPNPEDTTLTGDTTSNRTQHLFAVGYSNQYLKLTALDRMRVFNGKSYQSPAVRGSVGNAKFSAGAYAERQQFDSNPATRIDIAARAAPLSWLSLSAAQSTYSREDTTDAGTQSSTRVEAALRLGRMWFSGGVLQQSGFLQLPPNLITSATTSYDVAKGTAVLFGAHGMLVKDVGLDVQGIRWTDKFATRYRPQLGVRSDLFVESRWLRKFPKGQFAINTHLIHDYRGGVSFDIPFGDLIVPATTLPKQVITLLLEIRIQRAVITYQYRNLSGQVYEQIPGILMPKAVQLYGVRWEFWN